MTDPNESEAAVPSTDEAAMKGKFKSMDHQVMECIETMVDAWHKGVMNDDQALRSIRAYLKARSTVPWTTPLSEAEHQEMLRLYGIDTEASDD
jgi:hypothetical protein